MENAIKSGMKCKAKTEVYSRIVGYFSPLSQWNEGKKAEWQIRQVFDLEKSESEKKELK